MESSSNIEPIDITVPSNFFNFLILFELIYCVTGGNFRFDVFGLIFGGGQFLYFYGLRYHYRADTYLRHSNDIRDTRPTLNFIASKEKISFPFWINPFPRGKKEKAPGLYIHARRPLSRRSFNYSNTLT